MIEFGCRTSSSHWFCGVSTPGSDSIPHEGMKRVAILIPGSNLWHRAWLTLAFPPGTEQSLFILGTIVLFPVRALAVSSPACTLQTVLVKPSCRTSCTCRNSMATCYRLRTSPNAGLTSTSPAYACLDTDSSEDLIFLGTLCLLTSANPASRASKRVPKSASPPRRAPTQFLAARSPTSADPCLPARTPASRTS
jgi:hypothetical protein